MEERPVKDPSLKLSLIEQLASVHPSTLVINETSEQIQPKSVALQGDCGRYFPRQSA